MAAIFRPSMRYSWNSQQAVLDLVSARSARPGGRNAPYAASTCRSTITGSVKVNIPSQGSGPPGTRTMLSWIEL
jgi:hypothetical protein